MNTTLRALAAALVATALAGCATPSGNIQAAYVSPQNYHALHCSELRAEAERVSLAAQVAAKKQDAKAGKDAVVMTVGMVVFWPAIFLASGGDGAESVEVARLKGEIEAVQQQSRLKGCGIEVKAA